MARKRRRNSEHRNGDAARALETSVHRGRRQFSFVRQAPVPLETRGVVASFDAERRSLTAWVSTQPHYNARQNLSSLFGLSEHSVRVICEDVGGGFGSKSRPYAEEFIVAHASRTLRRPVKWIEDRFENLQATTHSRAMDVDLGSAATRTAGLRRSRRDSVDIGAYVFTSGIATAGSRPRHRQRLSLPLISRLRCAASGRTRPRSEPIAAPGSRKSHSRWNAF
jgi:carbon-monoxide dehydrogenase large subunit